MVAGGYLPATGPAALNPTAPKASGARKYPATGAAAYATAFAVPLGRYDNAGITTLVDAVQHVNQYS